VIAEETWGDLRDRAISLYVAHGLTLNYREQLNLGASLKELETGKPLRQKDNSGAENWFSLTPYGKEYLSLQGSGLGVVGFGVY
jgi:hypothetical protein